VGDGDPRNAHGPLLVPLGHGHQLRNRIPQGIGTLSHVFRIIAAQGTRRWEAATPAMRKDPLLSTLVHLKPPSVVYGHVRDNQTT